MNINNETKLQGLTANVFFPTMLIFLYFEDAYIVLAIYVFFLLWFLSTEMAVYNVILNSSTNGKSYIIKTIALLVLNGVFALLVKTQDDAVYKVVCAALLVYSTWFCYFDARQLYKNNKSILDKSIA